MCMHTSAPHKPKINPLCHLWTGSALWGLLFTARKNSRSVCSAPPLRGSGLIRAPAPHPSCQPARLSLGPAEPAVSLCGQDLPPNFCLVSLTHREHTACQNTPFRLRERFTFIQRGQTQRILSSLGLDSSVPLRHLASSVLQFFLWLLLACFTGSQTMLL